MYARAVHKKESCPRPSHVFLPPTILPLAPCCSCGLKEGWMAPTQPLTGQADRHREGPLARSTLVESTHIKFAGAPYALLGTRCEWCLKRPAASPPPGQSFKTRVSALRFSESLAANHPAPATCFLRFRAQRLSAVHTAHHVSRERQHTRCARWAPFLQNCVSAVDCSRALY